MPGGVPGGLEVRRERAAEGRAVAGSRRCAGDRLRHRRGPRRQGARQARRRGRGAGIPRPHVGARARGAQRAGRARRTARSAVGWSGPTVVFRSSPRPRRSATSLRRVGGRSGGYAIQTLGSTLVERLEGSVSNVVGLPVGLLASWRRRCSSGVTAELPSAARLEQRHADRGRPSRSGKMDASACGSQRALMSSNEPRSPTCIESKYAAAGRCSPCWSSAPSCC